MQSQAEQDSESRKRFFLFSLQHATSKPALLSSLQVAHMNAAWSYLSKTVLKSKNIEEKAPNEKLMD